MPCRKGTAGGNALVALCVIVIVHSGDWGTHRMFFRMFNVDVNIDVDIDCEFGNPN